MTNQDTLYFGFSSSQHDPAIAVVNSNGELIFAESNERSLKNKRAWNTVPDSLGSVDHVLDTYLDNKNIVAGLSWSDKSLKWSPLILWMIYWMKRFSFIFKNEKTKTAKEYENQVLSQSMYKAPNSSRHMLLDLITICVMLQLLVIQVLSKRQFASLLTEWAKEVVLLVIHSRMMKFKV